MFVNLDDLAIKKQTFPDRIRVNLRDEVSGGYSQRCSRRSTWTWYWEWLTKVGNTVHEEVMVDVVASSAFVVLGDENSWKVTHLYTIYYGVYILSCSIRVNKHKISCTNTKFTSFYPISI